MFVKERFTLQREHEIREMTPNFGYNGFGEAVYYRTYSRIMPDGRQEQWADTVIRVINGVFAIRKDWYIKNHILWCEEEMQEFAMKMAKALFRMEWLPPGRGLWAMGTNMVYERGSMPLYNCGAILIQGDAFWIDDLCWLMDAMMNGVGVGFGATDEPITLQEPESRGEWTYVVPDSREGWVESVKILLTAYAYNSDLPHFDYSEIRPYGTPLKTFGGTASGPGPLIEAHERVQMICDLYVKGELSVVQFKTDLANILGCCVVAGNIRRGAEIAVGSIDDDVFMDLKNYDKYPYRAAWGWMSNNSVMLEHPEDFERMNEIAYRVRRNGEPGYLNMINLGKGRIRDHLSETREKEKDWANCINPCAEIPLESGELCNVADTLPTRCKDVETWLNACEYATFYCTTVSLLPTHQPRTNAVIARNRRIGVGIIDFIGWKAQEGVSKVTRYLRDGYNVVREINTFWSEEAGVPQAIRVTTVKPGGSTTKLAGRKSGMSHASFQYMLRRMRVQKDTPIEKILIDAGYDHEPCVNQPDYTTIFSFPVFTGFEPAAEDVSLWEQAMNLILLQREWADNAVSNTLNFRPKYRYWLTISDVDFDEIESKDSYALDVPRGKINLAEICRQIPDQVGELVTMRGDVKVVVDRGMKEIKVYLFDPHHEEDVIEAVLAAIAPVTKSVSLLPHSEKGAYPQMPEEGIKKEDYESLVANLKEIDWSTFGGSDGQDQRYCDGDNCEVPNVR